MYFIPIIFIVLLISGTAFAYLMGAVSVLTFVALDKSQFLSILPQRIFAQLDVFAFMAMPLFILTAEIMSRAGVTRSLIDFAMSIVGRFRGGLGHVNILTSVFFAGISGSAIVGRRPVHRGGGAGLAACRGVDGAECRHGRRQGTSRRKVR